MSKEVRHHLSAGILVVAFLFPANLFAWGEVGHKTVGLIAQSRLTPAAKEEVEKILGQGQSLDSVASWADKILGYRPETGPWHYLDIDVRTIQGPMGLSTLCPTGDCVTAQIERDLEVLKSRFSPRGQRREALRFLVHFMGDLHQPLHCADDADRGGNEKWFRYHHGPARPFTWVNLHGIWDRLIRVGPPEDPVILASRLGRGISPQNARDWSRGHSSDWAFESFLIAKNVIYKDLPQGSLKRGRWGKDLPTEYYSGKMRDLVEAQLQKAGVRLAYLLNGLFRD